MKETFKVISEYLDRTGGEVEGRAREAIPEEVVAMFKQFAAGALEAEARADLAQRLKEHPGWVSTLASETKALRESDAPSGRG